MSGMGGGAAAGGGGGGGGGAVLADYLEKQQLDGKKKGKPWTKRWFVLDGNTLSYYDNPKAKQCKGSYVIGRGKITSDVEKLEFELRTDSYARTFKARNAQSFREWVRARAHLCVCVCARTGVCRGCACWVMRCASCAGDAFARAGAVDVLISIAAAVGAG
jgi:hypothetical protein